MCTREPWSCCLPLKYVPGACRDHWDEVQLRCEHRFPRFRLYVSKLALVINFWLQKSQRGTRAGPPLARLDGCMACCNSHSHSHAFSGSLS